MTYIYAYIFHSMWQVFDARKVETEEPSKMVFKLEAEAKLFGERAPSRLLQTPADVLTVGWPAGSPGCHPASGSRSPPFPNGYGVLIGSSRGSSDRRNGSCWLSSSLSHPSFISPADQGLSSPHHGAVSCHSGEGNI